MATQLVEHGKAADIPASVRIDGYEFLGCDTDFSYVTSDIIVTANLRPLEYIVNFDVEGQYFPTVVRHGQSAAPPFTPQFNSRGEAFIGWDKPLDNITSNTTIRAVFAQTAQYTVGFYIDGAYYYITVTHGESAVVPLPFYQYEYNSEGKRFIGWDRPLENITSDTFIRAIYET
jgi:hypothetical protein